MKLFEGNKIDVLLLSTMGIKNVKVGNTEE